MDSLSMLEQGMMQAYWPLTRLAPKQQATLLQSVCRLAICKLSNSSGPVRYVPKTRRKPSQAQDDHTSGLNHQVDDASVINHHLKDHLARKRASEAQEFREKSNLLEGSHQGLPFLQLKTDAGSCLYIDEQVVTSRGSNNLSYDSNDEREIVPSSSNPSQGEERSEGEQLGMCMVAHNATSHAETRTSLSGGSSFFMSPTSVLQAGESINTLEARGEDIAVSMSGNNLIRHTERRSFKANKYKYPKKRESDVNKETKTQIWQDAERFLEKIQGTQYRNLEATRMSHTPLDGFINNGNDDDKFQLTADENIGLSEAEHRIERSFCSYSTAEKEHAKNQAIRYLSMRPYTAEQLRKKLLGRGIVSDLVDYAISIVQTCGLQSDIGYAETFSYSRFKHGGWGPQRIKLGLKQRGVSEEIINAAIENVFSGKDLDIEQDWSYRSRLKISKSAMDHLLAQTVKQWNRGRNVTIEAKTRRIVSWLQYRGYSYDIVKYVLMHLKTKCVVDD
ncbi:hypothetical protein KP509_01G025200 [Ceratopteris richardii]|uniref:Regulatory protein RecX n=1 Tax=Ceratopteris richardii TaxID=49495 RepID=A0A8T2VEM7_CERRI|nr:hypothetical protein KP509_01G025200 [Ceratopteris richardii]